MLTVGAIDGVVNDCTVPTLVLRRVLCDGAEVVRGAGALVGQRLRVGIRGDAGAEVLPATRWDAAAEAVVASDRVCRAVAEPAGRRQREWIGGAIDRGAVARDAGGGAGCDRGWAGIVNDSTEPYAVPDALVTIAQK